MKPVSYGLTLLIALLPLSGFAAEKADVIVNADQGTNQISKHIYGQ